jgi:predicted TPR repeat methyltransferase
MTTINITDATLAKAVDLFKQGHYDDAQNFFLSVLDTDQNNPDALYFMGMIDHQAGRTEVAEHRANELIRLKPADSKALNLLGTILMSQRKLSEASKHFEKGIRSSKTDAIIRVNAAMCSIGEGNPDKSIEYCKEAIKINPDYANAYNILGNAYLGKSDYSTAAETFNKALEIKPDFLDARFNLGRALLEIGDPNAALPHFEKVLEANPQREHALSCKADVLAYQRKYTEAEELYQQAININDSFAPAYVGLGRLQVELFQPNDALVYFKRAIEINPNNIEALMRAGDAFRKLNNLDAAAAAFQDALDIDPDNAQAKYHLATVQQDSPPPAKPDNDYVRRLFDEFVPTYDESLANIEYNGPEQLAALARQFLPDENEQSQDILDIGCGTGLSGITFKSMARNLKGIDISPRMIDAARKRGIYDELEENEILNALVKHQNDTDLVVSADMFPYVGDLESIFLAITSALRSNGLFLFTVETHEGDEAYKLSKTARYSHSRKYITNLATRRGLSVLACNDTSYRKEAGVPVNGLTVALRKA